MVSVDIRWLLSTNVGFQGNLAHTSKLPLVFFLFLFLPSERSVMRLVENVFVHMLLSSSRVSFLFLLCFLFFFNDKSPTQDWIFFAWWVNTNTSKPKTCNKKCYSVKKSCLCFSNIAMGWRSWSLWLTERFSPLPIRRRTQPMKFVALVKMYKFGKHSFWHLVGALSHRCGDVRTFQYRGVTW